MKQLIAFAFICFFLTDHAKCQSPTQQGVVANKNSRDYSKSAEFAHKYCTYSWREKVWTTTFWVGQSSQGSIPGSSCNKKSAWERNWVQAYGGYDHPTRRAGFRPAAFLPKHNPFYVALPYNDLKDPLDASRWIPWWQPGVGRWTSQVKGRWLAIQHKGRTAYAQWKDVGPWLTHDPEYVFGGKKHRGKAGLDVSPAVRDYLGLNGAGYTRWRFVEEHEVPDGPWLEYGDAKQKILAARFRKKIFMTNDAQKHQDK